MKQDLIVRLTDQLPDYPKHIIYRLGERTIHTSHIYPKQTAQPLFGNIPF